jgi:hypothetical protein
MGDFPLDRLISIAVAHANEELHALAVTCVACSFSLGVASTKRGHVLQITEHGRSLAEDRTRRICRPNETALGSIASPRQMAAESAGRSQSARTWHYYGGNMVYCAVIRCSLWHYAGNGPVVSIFLPNRCDRRRRTLLCVGLLPQEGMMRLIVHNDGYRRAADRLGEVNKMIEQQVRPVLDGPLLQHSTPWHTCRCACPCTI